MPPRVLKCIGASLCAVLHNSSNKKQQKYMRVKQYQNVMNSNR